MANFDPSQVSFATTKARSQSDSNLLNPSTGGLYANGGVISMDDIAAVSGKRKNFLYKLVRPWKWRSRRKSKLQ